MTIVSLFAGCGGLDLGFEKAGFNVTWANEYDEDIAPTYRANHPHTILSTEDLRQIASDQIPDCDGIIGGPPCQSWSAGGFKLGIKDPRGMLFHEYIRVIRDKRPKFFIAENVMGILSPRHSKALDSIITALTNMGYNVSLHIANANHYNVPQTRKRVFLIGFQSNLNIPFQPPEPLNIQPTLEDTIKDLATGARFAYAGKKNKSAHNNHEYLKQGFSPMFMSRNRVRTWSEPAPTIPATGRHVPIHPSSPRMQKIETNLFAFKTARPRRFTVRECARIQTFPDSFQIIYTDILVGYRMLGNAVPVELAFHFATAIKSAFAKAGFHL